MWETVVSPSSTIGERCTRSTTCVPTLGGRFQKGSARTVLSPVRGTVRASDSADGQGLGPPAYRRLHTYPVDVVDGVIMIEVDMEVDGA